MAEPVQSFAETSPGALACGRCATPLLGDTNFCPKCGNDLRGTSATSDTYRGFLPGTVIDGRYRLMEKLGDGGMGTVFRVEHVRMGKVMALKVLKADLALQSAALERFRAEARIVSKLSHPNTISVFDFGELEGGLLYIAMEFVKGRDLSRVLLAEGRFSELRAAGVGIQVLRSLEEAHESGVVHRDIKPANVMLVRTRDGEDWAKVVDFGIAKLNEAQALKRSGEKHITGVAEFVGTPNYCAPEQIRGESPDARADLYALGAMLHELCTGKPPFEALSPMGVVAKHLSDPVPHARAAAPELSEVFDGILFKALTKDKAERFQSAKEMRTALEAVAGSASRSFSGEELPIIDGYEIASREDWDHVERALARGQRLRGLAGILLIAGLLALAGVFGYRRIAAPAAEVPVAVEQEINDEPAHANLIALDAPVRGAMGASHAAGKSDLDTFRLEVPSDGRLWVTLTGVQDLNLVLELFDADKEAGHVADPLTHVTLDDGRLGEGELLSDLPVHAGRYFLRVSERPAYDEPDPARPPRERANAPYTLTAHLVPASELDEIEPNDVWALAQPLGFTQPVLGHAGYPIPAHALERELVLSAMDFFKVRAPHSAVAFLVQPPDRALGLWDAQRLHAWRIQSQAFEVRKGELEKKVRGGDVEAGRELKKLVPPFVAAPSRASTSGVAVLRLESAGDDAGVLVAPLSGAAPTAGDAPYGLAFAEVGPGGLEAVMSLARELAARQRLPQARALVEAALKELPSASDADKARAALAQLN